MKILDIYIAKAIVISSLGVLLVLSGLEIFFALVGEFEDVGIGGYQYADAISYVLMTYPSHVYNLFPTAVLVGSLLGLGGLASNSELVVIRAAGVSVKRIVRSCIQAGFILMVMVALLGEFVVPPSEMYAQNMRMQKQGRQVLSMGDKGLWVRNHKDLINVQAVFPDLHMLNISVYTRDDQQRLKSIMHADSAHYQGDQWHLQNTRTDYFEDNHVRTVSQNEKVLKELVNPELFTVLNVDPSDMSARALWDYIEYLQYNKVDASTYQLAFWLKIVLPVSVVAMLLLALPFVFGHIRAANTGGLLLIGILLGVGFYMIVQITSYFGQIYGVPAFISAVAPVFLFSLVGIAAVRRVR